MRWTQGDPPQLPQPGNKMIVSDCSAYKNKYRNAFVITFCAAAMGAMKLLISLDFRQFAALPTLRSCDTFALDMAPSPPYPTPFEAFPP
jgi:hypothetical protein